MKVADFETFAARAEKLVDSAPLTSRVVLKYDHARGRLGVRVTDDKTCLQYATDQLADVKRVERLATRCLAAAATGAMPGDVAMAEAAPAKLTPAAAPAVAATGGGGGGRGRGGRAGGQQRRG